MVWEVHLRTVHAVVRPARVMLGEEEDPELDALRELVEERNAKRRGDFGDEPDPQRTKETATRPGARPANVAVAAAFVIG